MLRKEFNGHCATTEGGIISFDECLNRIRWISVSVRFNECRSLDIYHISFTIVICFTGQFTSFERHKELFTFWMENEWSGIRIQSSFRIWSSGCCWNGYACYGMEDRASTISLWSGNRFYTTVWLLSSHICFSVRPHLLDVNFQNAHTLKKGIQVMNTNYTIISCFFTKLYTFSVIFHQKVTWSSSWAQMHVWEQRQKWTILNMYKRLYHWTVQEEVIQPSIWYHHLEHSMFILE